MKETENTEQHQAMREEIKLILNELQIKIEQCTDIIAEVPAASSVRRISRSRSYYGKTKEQSTSSPSLRTSGSRMLDGKEISNIPSGVLEVAGLVKFDWFLRW